MAIIMKNIETIGNKIYFVGDITYRSCFGLNSVLLIKEKEIMGKTKNQYDPIVLYITSNGGSVHAAFTVVDTIQNLKVPVHTVVLGYVASAGTLISMAGSKRFITKNSYMLVHELSSGIVGNLSDLKNGYDDSKKIMDHIIRYYDSVTKIGKEKIVSILKNSSLSAEECVELKLVDEILTGLSDMNKFIKR